MTFQSQTEERKQNTSQDLPPYTGTWSADDAMSGSSSTKLLYFLIGGGIGAVTALMFAPKAGAELRHDISEITRTGYDETKDLARNVKGHSAEIYNTAKEKADRLRGLASQKLSPSQGMSGASAAGEQGRAPGEVLQLDDKVSQQQQSHIRNKSTDIM